MKLEARVKDQPYDIVNLKLEVPTVKGLLEKTPAYMTFEITSTEQKDVGAFLTKSVTWSARTVWSGCATRPCESVYNN